MGVNMIFLNVDMKENYSWKVHFFEDKKIKGSMILIFILFLLFFLIKYLGILYFLLGLLLVVYPQRNFYLPINYKVDEEGVFISNIIKNSKYNWDYFKKVEEKNGNIVLNPYKKKKYFKRKKKVILYRVPNKQEVLNFIKEKVS